jgi:hypothetical protein
MLADEQRMLLREDSLLRLRQLVDRSLPELRAASGIVTPPPQGRRRPARLGK